jgi:glycosyltransferase involved in cell wall biosynthesis
MVPPGVTVVVPVHDAGALLARCLDSLAAQDLDHDEFEVVAVDDGSTDGSGVLLDRHAARHPNMRVIHQERSGGPGGPRNVGTGAARGEFVFYLDADDALAPCALRRMLAFARESASDLVVVGRIVLEGDRLISPPTGGRVVSDARLSDALRSLAPHKLIRRALLVEHGIRFPEGRVTLEDGVFLARAAPHAGRISLLDDRAYYLKQRHQAQLSRTLRVRPMAHAAMRIVGILRTAGVDSAETELVAFRLYRRLLRTWDSKRFLRLPADKQRDLVATMQQAGRTLSPAGTDPRLRPPLRLRSLAFRTGRTSVVVALAEAEHDDRRAAYWRRPVLLGVLARGYLVRIRRAASRKSCDRPM